MDIIAEAILSCKSQLYGRHDSEPNEWLLHIPKLLNAPDNKKFDVMPTKAEIFDIIKSLPDESAAGQDGFNGFFYKSCWDIIKEDFTASIAEFIVGQELPRVWQSTMIILIPKVEHPSTFKDLRLISLCNFSSKVLSKLLASWFAIVLTNIISEEQSGLVKGRLISDNILLAQELIQSIKKKVIGG